MKRVDRGEQVWFQPCAESAWKAAQLECGDAVVHRLAQIGHNFGWRLSGHALSELLPGKL